MIEGIPNDFQSDGCTGIPDFNFGACCVKHDYDAYMGVPDNVADTDLFVCVAETVGGSGGLLVGAVMVIGLFLFRPVYRFLQKYVLRSKKKGEE